METIKRNYCDLLDKTRTVRKVALVLIALTALYSLSYFVFFCPWFYTDPNAYNSNGDLVGPTPWFCTGYEPPYSTSHEEIIYFTGKEWPFQMYRPFVNLYIRRRNREIQEYDEALKHPQKPYWDVNERRWKVKKSRSENPQKTTTKTG